MGEWHRELTPRPHLVALRSGPALADFFDDSFRVGTIPELVDFLDHSFRIRTTPQLAPFVGSGGRSVLPVLVRVVGAVSGVGRCCSVRLGADATLCF